MTEPVNPPVAIIPAPWPALGSDNYNDEAFAAGESLPAATVRIGEIAQATHTNALSAKESAEEAGAQATAAHALVNADKWVPGTDYPADETAWSPANKQTYRRNVDGISNTDPSLDPVGWTRVGGGDVVPQFFFTAQGII